MINPSKYRHTITVKSRTAWASSLFFRYAVDEGSGTKLTEASGGSGGAVSLAEGQWTGLGLERTTAAAGTPVATLPLSIRTNTVLEFLFVVRPQSSEASTVLRIVTPGPVTEASLVVDSALTSATLTAAGGASATEVNTSLVDAKWLAVGAQINRAANTVRLRYYTSNGTLVSVSDTSTGIDFSDATAIELMQAGRHSLGYVAVFNSALSDEDWKRAAWLAFKGATGRGIPIPSGLKAEEKDNLAVYDDIPARVTALSGTTLVRARQLDARITHKIEMREDAAILTPHSLIEFDGREMEAVAPIVVNDDSAGGGALETVFQARELVD